MKEFIKCQVLKIIHLWSRLYSYGTSLWIQQKLNSLYTMWICNFLGEVGKNTCFHYPVRLEGQGSQRIHIGNRTCIHAYSILGCWEYYGDDERYEPEIIIGDDCSIGEYCHISAINKITIGHGLLTGRFVYIGDNAHGGLSWEEADIPPFKRHLTTKGDIKIGNNVWIADRVTILGDVTIGDNVIIGAGSIVTHDLPNNCMAAGSPAKIIKKL